MTDNKWLLEGKPPRSECKKCEGLGWMPVPTFINCPACAGTGGIPCTCASEARASGACASEARASGACACVAGYKKKCRMCEGARVLEKAKLAPVSCPFCREK